MAASVVAEVTCAPEAAIGLIGLYSALVDDVVVAGAAQPVGHTIAGRYTRYRDTRTDGEHTAIVGVGLDHRVMITRAVDQAARAAYDQSRVVIQVIAIGAATTNGDRVASVGKGEPVLQV